MKFCKKTAITFAIGLGLITATSIIAPTPTGDWSNTVALALILFTSSLFYWGFINLRNKQRINSRVQYASMCQIASTLRHQLDPQITQHESLLRRVDQLLEQGVAIANVAGPLQDEVLRMENLQKEASRLLIAPAVKTTE